MGRFKKGLLVGGFIGGLLAWLKLSPKGKEYIDTMRKSADSLYEELKLSLKKLEGPTRDMYDALVERAVEEYANKKEMALDMKTEVMRELKKRWTMLEKEIRNK